MEPNQVERELWALVSILNDDAFTILGVTEEGGLIFKHEHDTAEVVV